MGLGSLMTAAGGIAANVVMNNPKASATIGTAVLGAVAASIAVPVALGLAGFVATGPAAGTAAAVWQATIGNVAAGSVFSVLQGAGMGGAAAATVKSVAVGAGAVAGGGLAIAVNKIKDNLQ